MTTTADTSTTDHVAEEAAPPAPESSEQADESTPAAKSSAKPHTNVPAPLAGPARRTALALGVPGLGLAELLAHANFGWAGVAAVTAAAVVGTGVVYAVRRHQGETKAAATSSKVGASKTPSSLASRLRAKPMGRESHAGGSGHRGGAGGRGLAGRMMNRLGGRGGGGLGRGGGLGGRLRGVAGRSGARSALGSSGHAGGRKARPVGAASAPGARTAAAKAKHLTGDRPSKTTAGLRSLANKTPHRSNASRRGSGRSGSSLGLGGGSFFGGGKSRSATGHSRHRGGHDHGRLSTTSGGHRPHAHRPRYGRRWQVGASMGLRWRIPLRRPRARTVMTVAGGLTLGMLAVPVVAAATAALGVYGACRLASSPRVRYGASVIAGWVRLKFSRAYLWARSQWRRARGKSALPEPYIAEGEPVDEPRTAPSRPARGADIVDAEIVPDPPTPKVTRPRFELQPFTMTRDRPKREHPPYLCQWTDPADPDRRCKELRDMGSPYCTSHQHVASKDKTCSWALNPSDPFSTLCGARIEPAQKYCEYHAALLDSKPLVPPAPPPKTPPPAPALEGHQPAKQEPPTAAPPSRPRSQPALASQPPASTSTTEKEPISVTMQNVIDTIASHDTFVPNDGPDTQSHLRGYPETLRAIARKFDGDLASIAAKLPQMEESLQSLAGMGQALDAFAAQLDEAFEQWRESASWVWQNQES